MDAVVLSVVEAEVSFMRDMSGMKEPRRRICFYSIATHLGGAEKSLLDIVIGLEKSSQGRSQNCYEPWLLLPKEDGPLIEELRARKIPFTVVPMPQTFLKLSRETPIKSLILVVLALPGLSLYFLKLIAALKSQNIRLFHTTGIKCHALSTLFGLVFRVPVLWHLRDILRPGLTHWALRVLRAIGQVHVIANSQATAEAFELSSLKPVKSLKPLKSRSIEIFYNGLDPLVYRSIPNSKYREHFKISAEVPVIGIMGVLARWKGQLEFLAMARVLISNGIDARFVLIGDQIYDTSGDRDFKEILIAKVKELGLETFVHFSGFEKDVPQVLNGLDILVHASNRPEPFGRVIVEAMACQVPVVASAAGGVLELIDDGKTGLLFKPGDVNSMAEAVKTLVKNPELRSALKKNGYENFLQRFTIEAHLSQLIQKYDRLLSGEVSGEGFGRKR